MMQTQCPYCQTIFRVTAAHINVAQGHVRCGQCRNVFDASSQLVKAPETSPSHSSVTHATGMQKRSAVEEMDDDLNFSELDFPEVFQEDVAAIRYRTSWSSLLFWAMMAIVLAGLLVAQVTWFWQPSLILQHPQLRPWLEGFCYTFLCVLPTTRDVNQFRIENKVVLLHPDISDAIKVDAIFVNEAPFPQPFPQVQLTFEDNEGRPLAQRRFTPLEYLHTEVGHRLMRPGATAHINLELQGTREIVEAGNVEAGYMLEFF